MAFNNGPVTPKREKAEGFGAQRHRGGAQVLVLQEERCLMARMCRSAPKAFAKLILLQFLLLLWSSNICLAHKLIVNDLDTSKSEDL